MPGSEQMTRVTDQTTSARHKTQPLTYGDIEYLRTVDDYHGVPRGTAIFGKRTVYGYPSIGRVLTLQPGLQQHFTQAFWAEEKVNGYNTRIFRVGDQILALSRGGFVCPFTTDRLADFIDTRIFDAHPDLVICAEVAGPGNPYLESWPPFIADDIQLYVFDFMRMNERLRVAADEKYALIEQYQLPAVRRYGRFTPADTEALLAIFEQLNREGREGLVFKESDRDGRAAKHVTAASALSDIGATAAILNDLPPEYFTNRVLRLVLYLREQGQPPTGELERELGAAFIEALDNTISQYERDGKVFHSFRCRFHHRRNAEAMFAHLKRAGGRQINISWHGLEADGEDWILSFDRNYPAINGLLSSVLHGDLIYD